MKIANAKTFGNNPYATTSDVASAISSHATNVGHMPSGGTAGNYLRKTNNGTEWAAVEIPNLSATIGGEWGYTKITSENVSTIASAVVEASATGFETVAIKQSSDDVGSRYTANASNKTFTFIAGDNVTFTNGENKVTINAVGGTPDGATSANVSAIASSIASSMMDTRLTHVYTYKNSVGTYSSLPSSGQKVGDVYNIESADATHGIKAGDNVAWNGTAWDVLAGTVDLSGYADKAYKTVSVKATSTATSSTSIAAGSKDDTLKLVAGANISMSANATDKTVTFSVSGIANGAEVNQSAYQTVAVKSNATATAVNVVANSKTATITFIGGDNVKLVGDNTGKTVTFSATDTTYGVATTASDGLMGSAMVTKLDGIASGAEVNQFAFKTVKVVSGNSTSTNVVADAKEDTLTLVAGNGVTLTANATSDSITIDGTTITAAGSNVTSIVASHGASISNTNGKLVIDVAVDNTVTENATRPVAGSGVFSHISSELVKVNSSINSSISAVETLIEAKASIEDLSQVAFTGDYNDLSNKPSTSTPPSQMIDFTSANTSSVTWNSGKTEATFTHTLNCIPNVVVYDNNWELTYVTIQLGSTPNNSTFKMVLDTPVVSSNAWHCIVTYGHHI